MARLLPLYPTGQAESKSPDIGIQPHFHDAQVQQFQIISTRRLPQDFHRRENCRMLHRRHKPGHSALPTQIF